MKQEYQAYKVVWEIGVSATSPKEAAEKALKVQRDPGSAATVFTVYTDQKVVCLGLEEEEDA